MSLFINPFSVFLFIFYFEKIMEFRRLEIDVISANDLKVVDLFSTMVVYVVVSINGNHPSAERTPIGKSRGSNRQWNCTVKFTIDEAPVCRDLLTVAFCLKFDCELGVIEIGTAKAPSRNCLIMTIKTESPPYQSLCMELHKVCWISNTSAVTSVTRLFRYLCLSWMAPRTLEKIGGSHQLWCIHHFHWCIRCLQWCICQCTHCMQTVIRGGDFGTIQWQIILTVKIHNTRRKPDKKFLLIFYSDLINLLNDLQFTIYTEFIKLFLQ